MDETSTGLSCFGALSLPSSYLYTQHCAAKSQSTSSRLRSSRVLERGALHYIELVLGYLLYTFVYASKPLG